MFVTFLGKSYRDEHELQKRAYIISKINVHCRKISSEKRCDLLINPQFDKIKCLNEPLAHAYIYQIACPPIKFLFQFSIFGL